MTQLDEPDPRAVEALDRLARATSTPRWERWASVLRPAPSGDRGRADEEPAAPRWSRRHVRVVAVGLAVAVLVGTLVVARRPEPFDERMPLTGSTTLAPAVAATNAPAPSDATAAAATAAGAAPNNGATTANGASTNGATTADDVVPSAPVLVHVAGAVDAPGVVELPAGSRVVDAVRAAGGLRADADPDRLNLAALIEDGHRIVVPVRGEPVPEELMPSGGGGLPTGGGSSGGTGSGTGDGTIDLNTATQEQLETLPGVGPATATAIIAHRDSNGPFRTVESLIDVRGIGEAKLDAVRDLVTVG